MNHRIVADFDRPPRDLVDRAAQAHVGVCGVHAGPRQVMHPAIKPLERTWRVCGPAFTVRSAVYDDLLVGELAGKYAQAGDVIVVDARGLVDSACWGLGMSRGAAEAGCNGVVIDGACMNGALVTGAQYQLPIFARGLAARAGAAQAPGSLNVPVACGGVIVNPGDIVIGDADGVVVLPPDRAAAILDKAGGHDRNARDKRATGAPYYKRRNAEEKLRALPGIAWEE